MLDISTNHQKISIVIPVYNNFNNIPKILENLTNQTFKPFEVIIIDSSTENLTENYLIDKKFNFNLIYKRLKNISYPGKARNIGINLSKGNYLGFIDSKTIPDIHWIKECLALVKNPIKCVIGGVKIKTNNYFQKILRSTSYGIESNETLVGTIIDKNFFKKIGFFNEYSRAGEDIDWLNRLKCFKENYILRDKNNIFYTGLPENIRDTIKKYIIYSYHTSKIEVLRNVKNLYLIFTLMMLSIVIPKYNFYIQNFEYNFFYFKNLTQIFVIIAISIILIILFVEIFFS